MSSDRTVYVCLESEFLCAGIENRNPECIGFRISDVIHDSAIESGWEILESMSHPGDKVHIPLKTDDALRGLLRVKPTAEMPRPGAAKKTNKKTRPK